MSEKLIAVIKLPQESPKTVEIEKGLKTLQTIVGGHIDAADLPGVHGVAGYVNDEGLLIGLEPNFYRPEWRDAIVGPAVFVGINKNGEDVSLTSDQVEQVINYLEQNNVKSFGEFLFHVETGFEYFKSNREAEM